MSVEIAVAIEAFNWESVTMWQYVYAQKYNSL